jgi:hypothetical protein
MGHNKISTAGYIRYLEPEVFSFTILQYLSFHATENVIQRDISAILL